MQRISVCCHWCFLQWYCWGKVESVMAQQGISPCRTQEVIWVGEDWEWPFPCSSLPTLCWQHCSEGVQGRERRRWWKRHLGWRTQVTHPHSPALSGNTLLGKGCPWVGGTHLHQLSSPPQGLWSSELVTGALRLQGDTTEVESCFPGKTSCFILFKSSLYKWKTVNKTMAQDIKCASVLHQTRQAVPCCLCSGTAVSCWAPRMLSRGSEWRC